MDSFTSEDHLESVDSIMCLPQCPTVCPAFCTLVDGLTLPIQPQSHASHAVMVNHETIHDSDAYHLSPLLPDIPLAFQNSVEGSARIPNIPLPAESPITAPVIPGYPQPVP
jgi:hypothetical protein